MGVINRCRRKNFKKEKKKSSQIFESANSSRSRSQRRSNGGRRCEIKPNPNAIGFKQLRAATKEEKKRRSSAFWVVPRQPIRHSRDLFLSKFFPPQTRAGLPVRRPPRPILATS